MEFWEGAVLVVGGLWLVGRMSRASTTHPLNVGQAALSTVGPQGNTVATNTDGSGVLVAGEPLSPMVPMLATSNVTHVNPVGTLSYRAPIHAPVFKLQPPRNNVRVATGLTGHKVVQL